MRFLLLAVSGLLTFPSLVLAADKISHKKYDLKVDFAMDGQHVFSPQLELTDGQVATVVHESESQIMYLDVKAKGAKMTNGKTSVFLTFVIGKMDANGQKISLSRMQIRALENEVAQISAVDEDSSGYSISVTAKTQSHSDI